LGSQVKKKHTSLGSVLVWRENSNYFNSLPSILHMLYGNTNSEWKIEH